jgi:hypothetical protein
MTISDAGPWSGPPGTAYAAGGSPSEDVVRCNDRLTSAQRASLKGEGGRFCDAIATDQVLVLTGSFLGDDPLRPSVPTTDRRVLELCYDRYGFPDEDAQPDRRIAVLLDSKGGALDSAFRTMLYLSRFASSVDVYVPRCAKSASTLVAVGADTLYMSPFAELGPLDAQINDPRNPAERISALDCYQTVDHVNAFKKASFNNMLGHLITLTKTRIPYVELIKIACDYASANAVPMLDQVNTLDYGTWGRNLKIGEMYATILLRRNPKLSARADLIATELVYKYTHHPFPIDIDEARRIKLLPKAMNGQQYEGANSILEICDGGFVDFLETDRSTRVPSVPSQRGRRRTESHSTQKQVDALGTSTTS